MKEIGIREFRKTLSGELKDLPITLTHRRQRVAVIVEADWYDGVELLIQDYSTVREPLKIPEKP